jgi:hypothetical protein
MINPKPVELLKEDLFNVEQVAKRVTKGFEKREYYSTISAIFAPQGSGRSSILNICHSYASHNTDASLRSVSWMPVFEAWKMTSIGNLLIALLWHIHRNLPEIVQKDEKIIFKLGRISVAIAALNGTAAQIQGICDDPRHLELISKSLPPERKSQVSSVFSACEQIEGLSEEFMMLGEMICQMCNCDTIVTPVDDLDRCMPSQAVPFLIALKTMMANKFFSFVLTMEQNILVQYVKSSYGSMFTDEQARNFVYKLFDDWVTLPSPRLNKLLENVSYPDPDAGLEFVSLVMNSGLYAVSVKPSSMLRACRRFESFLYDVKVPFKPASTDYLGWFGWFLVGAETPELITQFASMPDVIDLFKSLRSGSTAKKSSPAPVKKETKDSTIRIRMDRTANGTVSQSLTPVIAAETVITHSIAPQFLDEPQSIIMRFVSATGSNISEEELVWRLMEVQPFV